MLTADVNTAADLSSASRFKAVKKANAYCAGMDKAMIVRKMDTRQPGVGATADTDLTFSCVGKDDPEYRR